MVINMINLIDSAQDWYCRRNVENEVVNLSFHNKCVNHVNDKTGIYFPGLKLEPVSLVESILSSKCEIRVRILISIAFHWLGR